MKKLAMVLSLVAMVALTSNVFAQEKGQIQFGLSGDLYTSEKGKASGSKSVATISPKATVRYFVADKIGIDGLLEIKKVGTGKIGITLGVGGRYYYWGQDKMHLNGGVDVAFGLGDGAKLPNDDVPAKLTSPLDLKITPAEFEYWPLEGGAVYGGLFYAMNGLNLGDAGKSKFGLELGIKIRLK